MNTWWGFAGLAALPVLGAADVRRGGLKARPRAYECATCHRQESATAGTVLHHRTRTDLTKWFFAAYLMGRDKRGVSAKFLQRELGVAYQTAWTMAHKLRHGLSEDPSRPLHGFLEADETFIGGRGNPKSPAAAPPTLIRAWSSLPSRRCRRQRTGAESTGTPSSASTGFSPVMPASPRVIDRRHMPIYSSH